MKYNLSHEFWDAAGHCVAAFRYLHDALDYKEKNPELRYEKVAYR